MAALSCSSSAYDLWVAKHFIEAMTEREQVPNDLRKKVSLMSENLGLPILHLIRSPSPPGWFAVEFAICIKNLHICALKDLILCGNDRGSTLGVKTDGRRARDDVDGDRCVHGILYLIPDNTGPDAKPSMILIVAFPKVVPKDDTLQTLVLEASKREEKEMRAAYACLLDICGYSSQQ